MCNVCDGNGSSCKDCDGTAGGKKVLDLCGVCLEKTDTKFNIGCGTKLGDFLPTVGYVEGNMTVEIEAADLGSKTSVSCSFIDDETKK